MIDVSSVSGGDSDLDLKHALSVVKALLVDQGRIVLDRWPSVTPTVFHDERDFTTDVDLEVERNIIAHLKSEFPGHRYRGEETPEEEVSSAYHWLIDPIDGTKYYAGQASLFAISVGLLHRSHPVLGTVFVPTSGQCFSATIGAGAFLGDRHLEGPAAVDLSHAVVNVDTSQLNHLSGGAREWAESKLVELSRRAYRVRAVGVGSLAGCWVATGALDAYIDLTGYAKPHDVAASRIIMAESGARVGYVSAPAGPKRLLGASPGLFAEVEELLST